jgi:RND family efflux transporter MFP subunit
MSSETASPAVSRRGLRLTALLLGVGAAAIVITGVLSRQTADAGLQSWTDQQATPVVSVIAPDMQGKAATIDLPGRLEAYSQAQIYARVSGYLKTWDADIGAPVKAGQVLAEIDAPDLDQQIMQAQADLASTQANAALSRVTLERGQSLITSGAVSKQDLDQRSADFGNKQGLVKSAQANLDRLRVSEKYKQIVAPFDGLVTARSTDIGSLINAGSSGGPALFVVSDVSKLRVYVNVPQIYVPSIKTGTKAKIAVPEYPGRDFTARVEASTRSVDVASGTTRMQLVIDNSKGLLMTGAYATVHLELTHPAVAVNIPSSALIFDQNGLRVATVGAGDRIVLKQVTISRDLGKTLEIGTGLVADDRIVDTPPDGISTGDKVRIAAGSPAAGAPDTVSVKDDQGKPPG